AWTYFDRSDPETVGFLPLFDPPGSRWLAAINGQGYSGAVLVMRGGQGGGLPIRVRELSLQARGPCLAVGMVLNLDVEHVRASSTSGPAIGSVPMGVTYPVRIRDCYLESFDTCLYGYGWIAKVTDCYFAQIGHSAVCGRGSGFDLVSPFIAMLAPNST